MMSLVAWGMPCLVISHAVHGLHYGTALSGHLAL
jgi:hypothetical protein